MTAEQINQGIKRILIENPKRLNTKIHSSNHIEKNLEEIADAANHNRNFYQKHGLITQNITNQKQFEVTYPKFSRKIQKCKLWTKPKYSKN